VSASLSSAAEELSGVPLASRETIGRPPRARTLLGGLAFYAVLFAATIGVWQIAASFSKPLFFPPPAMVWASFSDMLLDGRLWTSIVASYSRILAGWSLGCMVGIVAGLVMARSKMVRFIFDPYLQLFRFLPAIALLPLLILWLGSGETSKIVLIMYASCFVVALATLDGALRVEPEKIRAARSLGANERQIFWLVVLPATMGAIITGIRLGMGGAFLAIVSAEMLAANEGLGFLIANSRLYMLTQHIFVSIAMLGLLGLTTDRAIRFASKRFGYRFQVKT
jgi:NitT/TauT family transport system permease protein